MSNLRKVIFTLFAYLTLTGCSEQMNLEPATSELHFKRMGGKCALRFAREPSFNVCVNGSSVGENSTNKVKGYLERALLTWMRAIKQIDQKVVGNINFSCDSQTHLFVNLRPGSGTSFASCGSTARTTIYVGKSYGTTLHELGHAFAGLADTYSGRSAGSCQPGQPASVMCWGAYGPNKDSNGFSLLWEDDVAGIQSRYKELFSDRQPMNKQLDLLGSIDVNNPWPGRDSNPSDISNEVYVQLVPTNDFTTEEIVLVSAPSSENAILACHGVSDKSCLHDKNKVKRSKRLGTKNGQVIYQLSEPVDPGLARGISIFAGLYNNQTFKVRHNKSLRFERID